VRSRRLVSVRLSEVSAPPALAASVCATVSPKPAFDGDFSVSSLPVCDVPDPEIQWEESRGVSAADLRASRADVVIDLNGTRVSCDASGGSVCGQMMASGPIALSGTPTPTNPIAFKTAFDRRGWKSFQSIPTAGETRLDIDSLWAPPGFNGTAPPAQSQVNRYGFTAAWDIPGPFGGRRPRLSDVATTCALTEPDHGVVAPTAGVELIDGVSTYRLVDRRVSLCPAGDFRLAVRAAAGLDRQAAGLHHRLGNQCRADRGAGDTIRRAFRDHQLGNPCPARWRRSAARRLVSGYDGNTSRRRSAAVTVFSSRQAMVIGPTPPGTGVIAPAILIASA
jgi:Inner membrane protein CreD